MTLHEPVLLKESIDGLITDKNGIYVDVTFGFGGHSREILKKLGPNGRLIGFDQDEDVLIVEMDDPRFGLHHANFRFLDHFLTVLEIEGVHGILADLGVSSYQLDVPERGFSYREDAPLDMRMNSKAELTAMKILNEYEEKELVKMFSDYGQVRNAKQLSAVIVRQRQANPFSGVAMFLSAISGCIRGKRNRYLSQVFQSLRIEVNDEMNVLKDLLMTAAKRLLPGGRLVVISYHSGEDRLVKHFLKTGNFKGIPEKDDFGNVIKPFELLNRKIIVPGEEELKRNSRSRSAKLRIGEKIEVNK
jgi:16S rRNA (cytosine1402-N4)-methyltransferase